MPKEQNQVNPEVSVSDAILKQFFEELGKQKDMKAVAERLEKTVLVKRSLTEPSIRTALFEDEKP